MCLRPLWVKHPRDSEICAQYHAPCESKTAYNSPLEQACKRDSTSGINYIYIGSQFLGNNQNESRRNKKTVALRICNYRVILGEGKWKSGALLTNFNRKVVTSKQVEVL